MKMRDYLWAVTEAKSMEEIWEMHVERMAGYGFDRLFYGYTQYLTPNSLGDPEDLVVLTNHDPEYGEHVHRFGPLFPRTNGAVVAP